MIIGKVFAADKPDRDTVLLNQDKPGREPRPTAGMKRHI
jgi:hypothetical protein